MHVMSRLILSTLPSLLSDKTYGQDGGPLRFDQEVIQLLTENTLDLQIEPKRLFQDHYSSRIPVLLTISRQFGKNKMV